MSGGSALLLGLILGAMHGFLTWVAPSTRLLTSSQPLACPRVTVNQEIMAAVIYFR